MAHNIARWTARIGLGEQVVTTKTLRPFFSLAGRLTRSARRFTLHLPQRWPWETQFDRALARFRALPLPGRRTSATDPTSPPTERPRQLAPVRSASASCRVLAICSPQPIQGPSAPTRLETAANFQSTRIQAPIIALVTPLPPSAVLAPSIGGFGLIQAPIPVPTPNPPDAKGRRSPVR